MHLSLNPAVTCLSYIEQRRILSPVCLITKENTIPCQNRTSLVQQQQKKKKKKKKWVGISCNDAQPQDMPFIKMKNLLERKIVEVSCMTRFFFADINA